MNARFILKQKHEVSVHEWTDFSGGSVQLNFKENINQFHSVFEFYDFGYLEL